MSQQLSEQEIIRRDKLKICSRMVLILILLHYTRYRIILQI